MMYVYSIVTHTLACVSCNPSGAPPTGNVEDIYLVSGGGEAVTGHLGRVISDDGRRVFFNSPDPLVPEDVNGKLDVYEYDVSTGRVGLISSGTSASDSYFLETTPDGSDALFATRQQLVGWDKDSNYDVYDARIGGGFPEPPPVPPVCGGEECRPALTSTALLVPPASMFADSAGNTSASTVKATVKCRAGSVRKRIRGKSVCVKRKTRKAGRRARHSGGGHVRRGK
jgi:hypothetical protein